MRQSRSTQWHGKRTFPARGSTTRAIFAPKSSDSDNDSRLQRTTIAIPNRQRASNDSLLGRLEIAATRIKHLEAENKQLRDALALALGEQRAADVLGSHDTPTNKSAVLIGPC